MIAIRPLTAADKTQAQDIWESRFSDSPSFLAWFFGGRFSPETSFCAADGETIASIAHGTPMRVRVRGAEFDAMMISGVATTPGYEGKGLMHAVIRALLSNCRDIGVPLAFHTPARFAAYRSLGQIACTDALYVTQEHAPSTPPIWDDVPPISELLRVYQLATARYSGCVARNEADMRLRVEDYCSDGGRCLAHYTGGALDGYLFAVPEEDAFDAPEVLAATRETYAALVSRLPAGSTAKLPPDAGLPGVRRAQGTMIPVDVSALLGRLCRSDAPLALNVLDPVLPWNDGVFDLSGKRTEKPPTDTLSVGRLMQFLCGYLPFRDVFDEQVCYCVDEY